MCLLQTCRASFPCGRAHVPPELQQTCSTAVCSRCPGLRNPNSIVGLLQAVVKVITSGSPRLFNPTAAAWYDRYMGAGNYIRLVNNRDVVPSLPLRHTPCAPRLAAARHGSMCLHAHAV